MIRISCDRNIDTFMYNKFPEIIHAYLINKAANLNKDVRKHVNKLLSDEFKIQDIYKLIELFSQHLKVNNQQNDYYITVEDVLINNILLESIVRAVDYGNSKFPPINLFNTSLVFVNNNLEALYKYYYLGVN